MTNEELIATIRNKIERRIRDTNNDTSVGAMESLTISKTLRNVLSILSDLEKEEKPSEGLEEEITRKVGDKRLFETGLYPYDCVCDIARHFAEWGAEHLKK